MIVPFKSAIVGKQNRDSTGSIRSSELPPVHVLAETRQKAAQRVGTPPSPRSANSQVHLDPVTGRIGGPPPAAERIHRVLSPEDENRLSTSSEGLIETPVAGPHGGVKIDLQGRFRSGTAVSIDAQGNLSTQCNSDVASKDSLPGTNSKTLSGVSESKGTHREK